METGSYHIRGRGSDLGIDVAGEDAAACLAAAVAAFAVAVTGADEPPPAEGAHVEWHVVDLSDTSPPALLVALVDELMLRLDADGRLGVALDDASVEVTGARVRLRGELALAELETLPRDGVTPKAATWHGVRLEPDPRGGWSGEIMLDL